MPPIIDEERQRDINRQRRADDERRRRRERQRRIQQQVAVDKQQEEAALARQQRRKTPPKRKKSTPTPTPDPVASTRSQQEIADQAQNAADEEFWIREYYRRNPISKPEKKKPRATTQTPQFERAQVGIPDDLRVDTGPAPVQATGTFGNTSSLGSVSPPVSGVPQGPQRAPQLGDNLRGLPWRQGAREPSFLDSPLVKTIQHGVRVVQNPDAREALTSFSSAPFPGITDTAAYQTFRERSRALREEDTVEGTEYENPLTAAVDAGASADTGFGRLNPIQLGAQGGAAALGGLGALRRNTQRALDTLGIGGATRATGNLLQDVLGFLQVGVDLVESEPISFGQGIGAPEPETLPERLGQATAEGLQEFGDMGFSAGEVARAATIHTVNAFREWFAGYGIGAEGSLVDNNFRSILRDYRMARHPISTYRGMNPSTGEPVYSADAAAEEAARLARLNTFSGPDSVSRTNHQLYNRDQVIQEKQKRATELVQAASQMEDGQIKDEFMLKASQLGAEAFKMQNMSPVDIIDANTNFWQELPYQMALDPTNLIGGVFNTLGFTPEVMRTTRAISKLEAGEDFYNAGKMYALGGDMGQRPVLEAGRDSQSTLMNVLAGGTRVPAVNKATQDSYVAYRDFSSLFNQISDKSDASLLLHTILTDPEQLVRGVAFTGDDMRRFADSDGLVHFDPGIIGSKDFRRMRESLLTSRDALQSLPSLIGEGKLNISQLVNELSETTFNSALSRYGVLDDSVPLGTKNVEVVRTQGNNALVRYTDDQGNLLRETEEMLTRDASQIAKSGLDLVAQGETAVANTNYVRLVGNTMRQLMSTIYLNSSPRGIMRNALGGAIQLFSDNTLSFRKNDEMLRWWNQKLGTSGLGRVASYFDDAKLGGSSADYFNPASRLTSFTDRAGAFGKRARNFTEESLYLNAAYSAGKRVFEENWQGVTRGLVDTFAEMGIDPALSKKLSSVVYEAGVLGSKDTIVEAFRNAVSNETLPFNLMDLGRQHVEAIADPSTLQNIYDVIKTSGADEADEALRRIDDFLDAEQARYANYLNEAPPESGRYVWTQAEQSQDSAEILQQFEYAAGRAGLDVEEAKIAAQEVSRRIRDVEEAGYQELTRVVTGTRDQRRYLYDTWARIHDLKMDTRRSLDEMAVAARNANTPEAWSEYSSQARQSWSEFSESVGTVFDETRLAINRGTASPTNYDAWDMLTRHARRTDDELATLRNTELGSVQVDDPDLWTQVIDANRAYVDKHLAQTYLAARKFTGTTALDILVSTERHVDQLGAMARAAVDKAKETLLSVGSQVNAGELPPRALRDAQDRYYQFRNRTWRELSDEQALQWNIATRQIVEDGISTEAAPMLRWTDDFAGGEFELLYPTEHRGREMWVARHVESGETSMFFPWKETPKGAVNVPTMVPEQVQENYRLIQEKLKGAIDDEINGLTPPTSTAIDDSVIDPQFRLVETDDMAQYRLDNPYKRNPDNGTEWIGENADDMYEARQKIDGEIAQTNNVRTPTISDMGGMHLDAIENLRRAIHSNIDSILTGAPNTLTEQQQLRLMDMMSQAIVPQFDRTINIAQRAGESMADFGMVGFNSGRHIDDLLGMFMPYHFWRSRTMRNWVERSMAKPQLANRMSQFYDAVDGENEKIEALPKREQGKITVYTDPETGDQYRIPDPISILLPSIDSRWIFNDWADPDKANGAIEKTYTTAEMVGFGFYPWLKSAYKGVTEGDWSGFRPGTLIPQYQQAGYAVQALTGNNLPGAAPSYNPYFAGREATNRAVDGRLSATEAQMVQDIARQQFTGEAPLPEETAQDYDNYVEASKQAGHDKWLSQSTSYFLGIPVYRLPEAELEARRRQQEYRTLGYEVATNEFGSKAAKDRLREKYDYLYPRWSQGTVTRESEDTERPGVTAQTRAYREKKKGIEDRIYGAGRDAKDELIASGADPSNREMFATEKDAAIDAARKELGDDVVDDFLKDNPDITPFQVVQFVTEYVRENEFPSASTEFTPGTGTGGRNPQELAEKRMQGLLNTAKNFPGRPEFPGSDASSAEFKSYYNALEEWDIKRKEWLAEQMRPNDPLGFPLAAPDMEEIDELVFQYENRFRSEDEIAQRQRNEEKKVASRAEWQSRRNNVAAYYGSEGSSLFQQYLDTPKGEARRKFKEQHPEMDAILIAAYNPQEYAQARETFGEEIWPQWSAMPPYRKGDQKAIDARNAYLNENPQVRLFDNWLKGRPATRGQRSLNDRWNFGTDYEEAKEQFGENIWDLFLAYPRGGKGRDRWQFRQDNPQFNDFWEWWYGPRDENAISAAGTGAGAGSGRYRGSGPGFDSLGHPAFPTTRGEETPDTRTPRFTGDFRLLPELQRRVRGSTLQPPRDLGFIQRPKRLQAPQTNRFLPSLRRF